jgi:hypothetical protein
MNLDHWVIPLPAQLWRVELDPERNWAGLELRDKGSTRVQFAVLDLNGAPMLSEPLSLGEQQWFGLTTVAHGLMIIHSYPDPKLPVAEGIWAVDPKAGLRWSYPELRWMGTAAHGLLCEENEALRWVKPNGEQDLIGEGDEAEARAKAHRWLEERERKFCYPEPASEIELLRVSAALSEQVVVAERIAVGEASVVSAYTGVGPFTQHLMVCSPNDTSFVTTLRTEVAVPALNALIRMNEHMLALGAPNELHLILLTRAGMNQQAGTLPEA